MDLAPRVSIARRRLRRRSNACADLATLLATCVLIAGMCLCGCSTSTVTAPQAYKPQTTPANVEFNLQLCYKLADTLELATLLDSAFTAEIGGDGSEHCLPIEPQEFLKGATSLFASHRKLGVSLALYPVQGTSAELSDSVQAVLTVRPDSGNSTEYAGAVRLDFAQGLDGTCRLLRWRGVPVPSSGAFICIVFGDSPRVELVRYDSMMDQ